MSAERKMSVSVDRFLAEKMGLCVHDFSSTDWKEQSNLKQCTKCHQWLPWHSERNPSPSTDPVAYLKMTDWLQDEDSWFEGFSNFMYDKWTREQLEISGNGAQPYTTWLLEIMLSTERGSEAVAKFLGWKGEK